MQASTKTFQRWLRLKLDRVDRLAALLDYGADVESVYAQISTIADEAANRAAGIGFVDLIGVEAVEPADVKTYLSRCIQRCRQKAKPEDADGLLSIAEAAKRLGISQSKLRSWCNHIDPDTGRHAPKIAHLRLGSRGRPSKRHSRTGEIRFQPALLDRFIEEHSMTPPVAMSKPIPAPRRKYKRLHF